MKTYYSPKETKSLLETEHVYCKINGRKYEVQNVNVNNKTFSASRHEYQNRFNFEDFDIEKLFFTESMYCAIDKK